MPTRSHRRLVLGAAATLVLGFVSCNKSATGPSPGPIVGLELVAPQEIAPGESVQLIANAVKPPGGPLTSFTKNPVENVTSQAEWTVSDPARGWDPTGSEVLVVTGMGLATGVDHGRVVVTASFGGLTADATILVLPKGTFRLSGRVTGECGGELGIENATVTVISGIGKGLTAYTIRGDYELYGVAGPVQIRAGKVNWLDRTQQVDVIAHGSLTFELMYDPFATQGCWDY